MDIILSLFFLGLNGMYDKEIKMLEKLKESDEEIFNLVKKEMEKEQGSINLIASENIASFGVRSAVGSIFVNRYAEGCVGNRFFGGCENIDRVEELAIKRAKKLFKCSYVNVQAYSGSCANLAVYFALLKPGDSVLGLSLNAGGHITHGSPYNISGELYNFIPYGLDEKTELIDYCELKRLAKEKKPKMIVAGASAYPRIIDFEKIYKIAREVGAYLMVDIAHIAGLICAGLYPSPFGFCDVVTATTNKTLRGPRSGLILCDDYKIAKKIDKALFPGLQGGPFIGTIAGVAVCFKEALTKEFREYQENIIKNSKRLAKELMDRGIKLISNGTDIHFSLIDLRKFKITGQEMQKRLESINIIVNKNTVLNDEERPSITSGIRVGTPLITTRGFKENDMEEIAKCIYMVLEDFEGNRERCLEIVKNLVLKYPILNF